jgi:hypothetical protein
LSGRAFATVQKSYAGKAVRAFGFPVTEFGLVGPGLSAVVPPVVASVGDNLRYRVMLDLVP